MRLFDGCSDNVYMPVVLVPLVLIPLVYRSPTALFVIFVKEG